MASPQAMGAALTYNPFLSGDANAKMFSLQRQAALAQALQTEGLTPLDTNNRSIGGVGYAISPMEGLAKLAQGLVGAYGQQKAASDYSDIYNPKPTEDQTQAGQQVAMNVGAANGQPGPTQDAANAAPAYAQGMASNPAINPAVNQMFPGMSQGQQNLLPLMGTDPNAIARVMSAYAPTPEQRNYMAAYGPDAAAKMRQELQTKVNPYLGMGTVNGREGVPLTYADIAQPPPSAAPAPSPVANNPTPPPQQAALPPEVANNPLPPSTGGIQLNGPNPNPPLPASSLTPPNGEPVGAPTFGMTPQQKAYGETRGKDLADTQKEIQQSGSDAVLGNKLLQAYQVATNGSYEGMGATARAQLVNGLGLTGLATPEDMQKATGTQVANAIANRITAEMNNTGAGTRLFQRITNNELGFLEGMSPQINQVPGARDALIRMYTKLNNYNQSVASDAANWNGGKGIDDQFLNTIRQKYANTSILDPSDISIIQNAPVKMNNPEGKAFMVKRSELQDAKKNGWTLVQ